MTNKLYQCTIYTKREILRSLSYIFVEILDRNQNTQIDNVFIDVPKDSIPESVSAKISFTGKFILIFARYNRIDTFLTITATFVII